MISRRRFLVTGSLAVASTAVVHQIHPQARAAGDSGAPLSTWAGVREQFDLSPEYTHLGLFYIASHPRAVRQAIESYRRKLDNNPFLTVERSMFEKPEDHLPTRACNAIASYIGGKGDDIALTQNTTTGLALLYHGFALKPGDEVLVTNQDHYVHHEAIRLAAERNGASWRKIAIFDSSQTATADGIVERIRSEIRPNTKVVGITWVHSSTGLKMPVRRIADAIAEINKQRADRVLLVVDGVHGIGVEDRNIVAMGMDAFAAGTHKWIFGPRGTGFVWAKSDVWATMRPLLPSFTNFDLFNAWAAEKKPATAARADWFTPGGFQAYEHYWALPTAFDFHKSVGYERITNRIHELNAQMREGLAKLPNVVLYTPRSNDLAAGIVCFDVNGMKQTEVVQRLLDKHKIIASTTPYAISYARVSFGIQNTEQEVEKTLRAIRTLA